MLFVLNQNNRANISIQRQVWPKDISQERSDKMSEVYFLLIVCGNISYIRLYKTTYYCLGAIYAVDQFACLYPGNDFKIYNSFRIRF